MRPPDIFNAALASASRFHVLRREYIHFHSQNLIVLSLPRKELCLADWTVDLTHIVPAILGGPHKA